LDNADELPEGIATRPEIVLSQNHPNPFLPASSSRSAGTSISYHVSQNAAVNLTVYNIRGQRVKRLFEGEATAGRHTVYWDGRDEQGKLVGSGIYFYKLSSEHETQTKKMLLVR
jgi:flagellar hook assembly protein FlgD